MHQLRELGFSKSKFSKKLVVTRGTVINYLKIHQKKGIYGYLLRRGERTIRRSTITAVILDRIID